MKLNPFEFIFEVGVSVLRVFEKSRGSIRSVFLSWWTPQSLFEAKGAKEFVKSPRVGSKAFIIQCCANKFDRFLAITEYGGEQKGSMVILEGRGGSGWSGFAQDLLKFQDFSSRPTMVEAELCQPGKLSVGTQCI